ncbi:MAG: hypothetical protein KAI22_09995 [Gammaproteobacteria bacterium]|nr:hypothetical protein [Gammaproteobacteria bacterium]
MLLKPVNDLSRGCLVADIINTVAITAVQAQSLLSSSAVSSAQGQSLAEKEKSTGESHQQ